MSVCACSVRAVHVLDLVGPAGGAGHLARLARRHARPHRHRRRRRAVGARLSLSPSPSPSPARTRTAPASPPPSFPHPPLCSCALLVRAQHGFTFAPETCSRFSHVMEPRRRTCCDCEPIASDNWHIHIRHIMIIVETHMGGAVGTPYRLYIR